MCTHTSQQINSIAILHIYAAKIQKLHRIVKKKETLNVLLPFFLSKHFEKMYNNSVFN